MGCPETDGGEGNEHVLTGFEGPGTSHFEGDAEGVAREGLDDGDGVGLVEAEVPVYEGAETDESLRVYVRDYSR
jgi:hypothetical protein